MFNSLLLKFRATFSDTSLELDNVDGVLTNITQGILSANASLDALERRVDALQSSADDLKSRAINLQEANVEGMYVQLLLVGCCFNFI